jgi:hypothetical protein
MAATAVLGATLVGCGSEGGTADTRQDANKAPVTSSKSNSPANTGAAGGSTSPKPPAGGTDKFCNTIKAMSELDDGGELTDARKAQALAAMDAMVSAAPPPIHDAAKMWRDELKTAIASGKNLDDVDDSEFSPELTEAFGKLMGYIGEHCPEVMGVSTN